MTEVVEQVQLLKVYPGTQFGRDLPNFVHAGEIFDQHLDRQSALHLELAVDSGPCPIQRRIGKIGGEDLDAPTVNLPAHLGERDGERIGFLSGRCSRTPNPNLPLGRPCRHERRHHHVAEILEWNLAAEKKRLLGPHPLPHPPLQPPPLRPFPPLPPPPTPP